MSLDPALFVHAIDAMHQSGLSAFLTPDATLDADATDWLAAARINHFHNCRLWRQEDLARRVDVASDEIVKNKRSIDRHNQARNDAIEKMDVLLLATLPKLTHSTRLNSETPGAMIDRLSILSLKIHHMKQQVRRQDADMMHRRHCAARVDILMQQHDDLRSCLENFVADCVRRRAHFRLYRQFKMYNDPQYHKHV